MRSKRVKNDKITTITVFINISASFYSVEDYNISVEKAKKYTFQKKNSVFIEAKSISKKQFENTDN